MKAKKKPPYHHLFRVLHWVLAITMPLLICTGIGLHSVGRPDWSLINEYVSWFPGGRVMFWHLIGALCFVPAALISSVLFLKRFQPPAQWSWRWLANFLLVIGSLVSLVTAFGLLYNVPNGLYQVARFIHACSGLIILPFAFIVHLVLAFTVYLKLLPFVFFPFRHPKWSTFIWIPVVAILTTAAINQLPAKMSADHRLVAEKIADVAVDMNAVPGLDWEAARPLKTRLVNGVGFNKGVTGFELRAMYDSTYLYMRAQWEDDTDNTEYWPVQKTSNGWKYLQNSLYDEQEWYEDKFSLLFPVEQSVLFDQVGCAVYCHQSSDTEHFPYGYKAATDPVDVWHWKAARTGSMGYIDDKYWQGHDTSLKDVGRKADSGDKAGYLKNISKDLSRPLYLPKDKSSIVDGAILKSGAVEYTEELGAKIPEGTIIPGIVVHDIQSDRGNVRCISEYKDGLHTLWIRRQLDTGSGHDVRFIPGEAVSFGAAVFDHAAKRHAYNMTVYKLLLKP